MAKLSGLGTGLQIVRSTCPPIKDTNELGWSNMAGNRWPGVREVAGRGDFSLAALLFFRKSTKRRIN